MDEPLDTGRWRPNAPAIVGGAIAFAGLVTSYFAMQTTTVANLLVGPFVCPKAAPRLVVVKRHPKGRHGPQDDTFRTFHYCEDTHGRRQEAPEGQVFGVASVYTGLGLLFGLAAYLFLRRKRRDSGTEP